MNFDSSTVLIRIILTKHESALKNTRDAKIFMVSIFLLTF